MSLSHRLSRHLACAAVALAALPATLGCTSELDAPSPEGPITEAREALSTCVTLQRGTFGDVADTTITANVTTPGWMSSAPTIRAGGTCEVLLRFDVSAVPSNATVSSATLNLYTTATVSNAYLFARYSLAPWTEATSSFASLNQQVFNKITGSMIPSSPNTLQTMTLKPATVQGWVSGALPNYGIVLETMITNPPNAWKETVFVSSESPTVSLRPALQVCYTTFNHCAAAPCLNGATCESGPSGYTCTCAPGFTGTNCEINIDDCAGSPCLNGGSCADGVNGYTCQCPAGYTGANCETDINECTAGPCLNGGVCSDQVNAYSCACPPGFAGTDCEINLNECAGSPCLNGGACSDGVNGYTCTCSPGFTGTNCEINIDDCAGNACQNGSTCADGVNGYTCACVPGYSGAFCQTSCDDQVDEGCSCTSGATQPCYGGAAGTLGVGACHAGTQTCTGNQWGACVGQALPAAETCDGADNDCDGVIDNGNPGGGTSCGACGLGTMACSGGGVSCSNAGAGLGTYYADADGDGYGDPGVTTQACAPPGGYVTNSGDCNDGDAAVHPGAAEVCNGVDDNCNGTSDEGCNPAAPMSGGRAYHTATLLQSGKVLITGGYRTGPGGGYLASAELYDPATSTFSPAGSMSVGRAWHTATLLPTGKVLVAGGVNNGINPYLASAELYDPATNTFSPAGSMAGSRRAYHTATLLPSGKVLLAGGYDGSTYLASAKLYDPATNIFSGAASLMSAARAYHTATRIPSGQVLVAGGVSNNGGFYTAELYNPATNTFSAGGTISSPRAMHTATLLQSGKVLLAGGYTGIGSYIAGAALYDPATKTVSVAGSMSAARGRHTATLLPSGEVLVTGGYNYFYIASEELYDPATNTFSAAGSMSVARESHTATLLQSGQVLIVGGFNGSYLASAELYGAGLDNDCNGIVDDNASDLLTWYRDADGDGYGDPGVTTQACAPPPGYVANGSDCNDADPAMQPGDGTCGGFLTMALVCGGESMSSVNNKMVVTLGESLGGGAVMSSPNNRIHGGLVGATQRGPW